MRRLGRLLGVWKPSCCLTRAQTRGEEYGGVGVGGGGQVGVSDDGRMVSATVPVLSVQMFLLELPSC